MKIKIIKEKISQNELEELAREFYVDMVKGAVDIDKEIIALGGEWHMDANQVLIDDGSSQRNIWGFNIYLDNRIEFISLINIRPLDNNRTLEIEDSAIREKMSAIIRRYIK